jgi:hypothetical protein
MKKTFEVKEVCKSCNGTGLYKGMGERDGFGVVCYTCKGTGCHEFTHHYEEFKFKMVRSDIQQVIQANPGIALGVDEAQGLTLKSFGGMSYKDWVNGRIFPKGSEMRAFVCPAWWYQTVNYEQKPGWKECTLGGTFSGCSSFFQKGICWKRFDHEQNKKA